jgi:hypothetical protein
VVWNNVENFARDGEYKTSSLERRYDKVPGCIGLSTLHAFSRSPQVVSSSKYENEVISDGLSFVRSNLVVFAVIASRPRQLRLTRHIPSRL